MVKTELYDLKLNIDGYEEMCVRTPFSVKSALVGAGEEPKNPKSASVFANIFLDGASLSSKYMYLRLSDVNMPCEAFVGGESVGRFDSGMGDCIFDLSGRLTLGDNLVEIRFFSEEGVLFAGVFGVIEFLRFNSAMIDKVRICQKHEGGSVTLKIKVSMLGASENVRAVATLVSGAGQMYYGGLTKGKGSITVKDPLYWWPRGLGVQNIYKLTVNLYGDAEIEDTREMKVGLRKIQTVKNADGSLLEVGGKQLFPMGAVLRIGERAFPDEYNKKCEAIVTSAAMAGYNCLLSPLGEPRLPERFFELCDLNGIAVIKETSFADNKDFEDLSRLCHHPSLAIVDIVGAGDRLDEIVEELHRAAPDLEFSVVEEQKQYFGVSSLPTDTVLLDRLPQGERNLFSPAAERLIPDGREMFLRCSERYLCPDNIFDFAYASRLCSAETVGEEMRRARLFRGSFGRAVYNGIYDSQTSSSAALDEYCGHKALQYHSAKFFAPAIAVASRDGYRVSFCVSNERQSELFGEIEYKILDAKNSLIYKGAEEVSAEANSSKKLFVKDFGEYISGKEREYYLEYSLKEGASVLSRNTLLFVPEKSFAFEDPEIKAVVIGADKRFTVTISAKAFSKGVEIDFPGAQAILGDNYFDITSQAPIKVSFSVMSGKETAESLSERIKIRSVYDIGKNR